MRRLVVEANYFNRNYRKPALVVAAVPYGRYENGRHDLRHFFASKLLDQGESIKAVAEWLWHGTPAVVVSGLAVRTATGYAAGVTDVLERVRELCLALPEATERLSHGEPTWFVRGKKTFVMYADHHHDDRVAFWCAAAPGVREALLASRPDNYFYPPYVGHRGWLGVWLDVPVDWGEIGEIVVDAYRAVAPKRLVALLDET